MRTRPLGVLTSFLLCCLLGASAAAQTPQRVATTTSAVTVASTGVFQQALASSSRNSCTLQYTGSHTGYVFFGSGTASTTNAYQLANGATIMCATPNGLVLTDQVQVSGTTGDTFVVTQQ